jgi:hypothetical protein
MRADLRAPDIAAVADRRAERADEVTLVRVDLIRIHECGLWSRGLAGSRNVKDDYK